MKRTTDPTDLAPATISESDGVRYLHLGTPWVQGAMRIRKPLGLELEYIQRMMAWMLLRPEAELAGGEGGVALQFGLGAAAITRYCHGVLKLRTAAVELNPTVIDACRLWFKLPPDGPRLHVQQGDAAAFAADPAHREVAASLCDDLYDHEAASPVLDSAAFYADCHAVLVDGGVMSVNLFGRDASFERSAARFADAFGAERVASLRPTREGNTVVLALKNAAWPERATLAARADNIERRYQLPARKWLRMIRPWMADAAAAPDRVPTP